MSVYIAAGTICAIALIGVGLIDLAVRREVRRQKDTTQAYQQSGRHTHAH